MGLHRFYHLDREKLLTEGQVVALDEHGMSRFGSLYREAIFTKPFEQMSDAERRELMLENIRKEPKFSNYTTSRLQAFFGANSIEEIKRFAERIEPKAEGKVPVYEVFASEFWTLDMNWLDSAKNLEHVTNLEHSLLQYWYGSITNHNPEVGERNPPNLEILMTLPVTIGRIVEWI